MVCRQTMHSGVTRALHKYRLWGKRILHLWLWYKASDRIRAASFKKMIRAYVFKECEMSRAELFKKKKFLRTVKFWTLSSTNLNGTPLLSSHLGRISWASSRHGEQVIKFILSTTSFPVKLQISHVSKGPCTYHRFKVITLQRLNKIVSALVTLGLDLFSTMFWKLNFSSTPYHLSGKV